MFILNKNRLQVDQSLIMPVYSCPYPDCTYSTNDVNDELAAVMLRIHADGAHTHSETNHAQTQLERSRTAIQILLMPTFT